MIDSLLQAGLSNLLVSLALAGVAFAVQRRSKQPLLAHLLWLAVLIKLLTPPLLTLPLLTLPSSELSALTQLTSAPALPPAPITESDLPLAPLHAVEPARPPASTAVSGKVALAGLWLLGSLSVLGASLRRILRFDALLRAASLPAPPETQALASELAGRLGLARTPSIVLVEARLTPLVWWFAQGPRVVLPAALHRELDPLSLRWVLAHELGHLRRRDHVVRWLEWLACVAFWWNPVAWWARRNLRANEELCCDALVLGALSPEPREYAGSLLHVAEFLTGPTLQTPAVASTLDGADSLERRIRMILADRPLTTTSRRARGFVLLCALALLPFGVAQAGEPDYEAVSDRLLKAVAAGELSPEQAEAMMGKLAKVRFAERVAALGAKQGKKAKRWNKGKGSKALAWVPGHLEKLGLDGKQRKQTLGAIKKVVALAKSKAEYPEAYAWVRGYLERLELTPKQIEQVEEVMKKAAAIATEAEGRAPNWQAQFGKLGLPAGAVKKFRVALDKAGVTGERQETALGAVLKLAHVWRQNPDSNHDDFHREVKRYLVGELELSGEQVGLVFGLAKRAFAAGEGEGRRGKLRDHYRKLGIDGPVLDKIAASLRESGLEGEQVDQALGGIARLLYGQLKPESSRDELRAGLVKHFKKSGFSGEQIEHLVGLAKEIFPHVKERLQDLDQAKGKQAAKRAEVSAAIRQAFNELGINEEVLGKVQHRLGEFGLKGKQIEGALGGMIKVLYGLKAKGKDYQLGSRLDGYFHDLGLNEKQIQQVLGLSRRLNGLGAR